MQLTISLALRAITRDISSTYCIGRFITDTKDHVLDTERLVRDEIKQSLPPPCALLSNYAMGDLPFCHERSLTSHMQNPFRMKQNCYHSTLSAAGTIADVRPEKSLV